MKTSVCLGMLHVGTAALIGLGATAAMAGQPAPAPPPAQPAPATAAQPTVPVVPAAPEPQLVPAPEQQVLPTWESMKTMKLEQALTHLPVDVASDIMAHPDYDSFSSKEVQELPLVWQDTLEREVNEIRELDRERLA